MNQLRPEYRVGELAEALEVSPSGFHAHRHKAERPRRQQDQQLLILLRSCFLESRGTYGSPRLTQAVRCAGYRCGKNRVARLMRQADLRVRQKRRFRPRTTQSDPRLPAAPNWLARLPSPDRPNQIWVSDITYLPTQEGWLYLAVTLDACSRKCVGWSMADALETPLVTEALEQARQRRQPPPGLLHHSDRGSQYASRRFQRLLQTHHITPSMSRPSNCYDNALAESFFATLKTECFDWPLPPTKAQAKLMAFDYIETFYNPRRFHSALGYQSPMDFENQFR